MNFQTKSKSTIESWEKFFSEKSLGVTLYEQKYTPKQKYALNSFNNSLDNSNASGDNTEAEFTDKSTKKHKKELDTYILKLRVSKLNYGGCCAWELITNQIFICNNHPFSRIDKDEISWCSTKNNCDEKLIHIGGINADNIVMRNLFNMIMMSDEELFVNSGHHDHRGYRARLIKMLIKLWD